MFPRLIACEHQYKVVLAIHLLLQAMIMLGSRTFFDKWAIRATDKHHFWNPMGNIAAEEKDQGLQDVGLPVILPQMICSCIFWSLTAANGSTAGDMQTWTCVIYCRWIPVIRTGSTSTCFGCRIIESSSCYLEKVKVLKLGTEPCSRSKESDQASVQ